MTIEIRHSKLRGTFKIDTMLYNRGDCLGIDFNNTQSQILISDVPKGGAQVMQRELQAYIDSKENNVPDEEFKTAEQVLNEVEEGANATIFEVTKKIVVVAMKRFRLQGRYYSPDEIRKIQEIAYDAGLSAGSNNGGSLT